MAREGRGESGQWAPGRCSSQPGEAQRRGACAGRDARSPARYPAGHSRLQQPLPTECREETGTGGQRHRGEPRRSPTRTRALAPQPTRAPPARKRRRKRAHLELSRGAAGARGAAASLAAAAGRGVAEKAPFSGAARACSPAAPQPLSASRPPPPQLPAPRLDACSLGFPLGYRRGVARRGRP